MAEAPKELPAFDISDIEITAAETPKAKRKRATKAESALKSVPAAKSGAEAVRLPGVHETRKPKRGKKAVSSEGKLSASASGEIVTEAPLAPEATEVEEALADVRRMSEESAWDAKIAEAKGRIEAEEREKRIAEMGDRVDRAMEAEDEVELTTRSQRAAEMGDRVDRAMEAEDAMGLSDAEQEWFKKGDDKSYIKEAAEKQEMEDLRKGIATYDERAKETILDTQGEIDATVRQAEEMLKKDELHPDVFDIRDYEYLLTEQARLDRELETAGWWAARKLRGELKDVRKDLEDYENQIQSVMRERADARDAARGIPSIPARKVQAREGSGTTVHKEGGGTSIHMAKKPGFFSRLFGRK